MTIAQQVVRGMSLAALLSLAMCGRHAFAQEYTVDLPASGRSQVVGGKAETTCSTVTSGDVREFCLTPKGEMNIFGTVTATSGATAAAATVDSGNNALTTDTTLEPATANLRLLGWTARESAVTAAVATFILRHGVEAAGSCTGNEIAYVELDANQAIGGMSYGPRGLAVASGVCADVLAGTIDVNIFRVAEPAP